jgi:hypothetical protein
LLKKAFATGEFLQLKARSFKVSQRADHCLLFDVVDRLATPRLDLLASDIPNLNTLMNETLLKTYQEECEAVCARTPGCEFVHKSFFVHWYRLGVNEFYFRDQTMDTFEQNCHPNALFPIISVNCTMFLDVHFITHLPDKATVANRNFGNIISSLLVRPRLRRPVTLTPSHKLTVKTQQHMEADLALDYGDKKHFPANVRQMLDNY